MRKKYLKPVICSFSALLLLTGALYGCNFRESLPEQKAAGKLRSDPLSEVELRKFASAVRPIDGDAEAHYQLALHFQENNRHKLAIDELRLVLQRNPAHVKAYNALGVSYDNLGDHEAAIGSYQIALKIEPNLDYVCNNLGYSYLLNGQTAEAAAAFYKAIAINPKEKRFRNNLALAYVKQDSYEQAYEQFRAVASAAEADKTFAKAMRDLGKGAQTERVLLAARSAAAEQAKTGEPAAKLPDLAEELEPSSANDPIARYQAVTGSMGPAPRAATPESFATQTPKPTSESSTLSVVQNKGPELVVYIPPPTASQENLYELKLTTALPEPPVPVALSKRATYYPIASVALAGSSTETPKTKAVVPSHSVVPVQKELHEIEQPAQLKVEESREQQEERILVAASSARAAGWQNAPEPRATAEKGLVEVEVANGNGVKGSAGKVAAHLRKCGFNVVRVIDAQSHDHFSTKVFYYGNMAVARQMLDSLPDVAADAELYELEGMGSRIRLLIGKDMILQSKIFSTLR